MKKLIIFIISLITVNLAKAGDDNSLHFGLKITPSLAWLRTDTKGLESNGSKFGFSYGLITEFRFSDHYSFATGIDVAYRGGNLRSTSESTDAVGTKTVIVADSKTTLQYIEIPLTLKLKTSEIGYLTYYLQAGVSPGFNIRARADNKTNTQTTFSNNTTTNVNTEETGVDIQKDINAVNLSMIIGGGVEYTLSGSTVLLVGIQFNNGLFDVLDASSAKANSNYLGLSIGILF